MLKCPPWITALLNSPTGNPEPFDELEETILVVSSFTSPQAMSRCSWHPLNPKWTVLKNHSVFDNASALKIPRRFCSKRMFTSSSVKACAALGLLPFPCFFSYLLRASRHFLVCSNSAPSMMLRGYFCSLKCLLKLVISPRRLDSS